MENLKEIDFNNIETDMNQDLKKDFENLIEVIIEDLYEQGGYDPSFIKEYLQHLIDKN
jgi:hypothetical protein